MRTFRESISDKSALWSVLLFAAIFLVSMPLFRSGMFKIHDFTHGARIAEMTRALEDGHFPVRWSQNFGFGYGMPLFQFYGPLPFYVGSVVYWLTGHLIFSVKTLFLISNIFTAWGAYLLGKKLFKDQAAAAFVSLAITLAPYRILNLYVRGAVNELWGIMAIPWIILGIVKTIKSEKSGWLVLCLGFIALFLSHNITTMIFAPFAVLSVVVLLIDHACKNKLNIRGLAAILLKLAWPVLLAVGFSAFYLFPAYFEKDFTQVEQHILADYFNFRMHFLYIRQFFRPNWGYGGSQWGPDDPISFFLGFGQILSLIIASGALLQLVFNKLQHRSIKITQGLFAVLFFLFFSALALFFTTHYSLFFWNALTLLKFVQFPWRFLSIAIIFIGLLTGAVTKQLLKKSNKSLKSVLLLVLLTLLLANLAFVRPEKQLINVEKYYYSDPIRIAQEMSKTLPDYIPLHLDTSAAPDSLIILDQEQLTDFRSQLIVNKTHYKIIEVESSEKTTININVADYPNWQVSLNSEAIDHTRSQAGTILVDIASGINTVELKLKPTALRLSSDLISLISFGIVVVLFLVEDKLKKFSLR